MSTEAHHDAPAQHGGAQAAQVTTNAPPGDEDFPDPDEDDLDDLDGRVRIPVFNHGTNGCKICLMSSPPPG